MVREMSVFILVHGAWHGAWCWDRFVPELEALGHETITMDMPVDDGAATFSDYAQVVVDAAADAGDDAVVVGHSLGSMVIPLVAARRPVRAMVFLCGVIPNFGGSPWDGAPPMAEPGVFEASVTKDDGSVVWPDVASATNAFYSACAAADAAWAFERLRPQNSASLWSRPYPLDDWPDGRRIAINTLDDRSVVPAFGRFAARDRLGVEPIEMPGDHSPFLGCPAELARVMTNAVMN